MSDLVPRGVPLGSEHAAVADAGGDGAGGGVRPDLAAHLDAGLVEDEAAGDPELDAPAGRRRLSSLRSSIMVSGHSSRTMPAIARTRLCRIDMTKFAWYAAASGANDGGGYSVLPT